MKRYGLHRFICVVFVIGFTAASVCAADYSYDVNPPFSTTGLEKVKLAGEVNAFDPRNPYNIFINYELGMHCVGFDVSYCCVIPPYNSVQAQAVKAGTKGGLPMLLSPDDGYSLYYHIRDNSYSEGNKMRYWEVRKDVFGNGNMNDPGDNIANYVWTHLFIYKDLEGTLPPDPATAKRLYVGKDIQVKVDSGPTGKSIAGGYLTYAGAQGGNKVFTDSLIPEVKNVSLTLTSSYLWDALGLPLTAFNDSRRKGTIRSISDGDFQPYQYSVVQLRDKSGNPVKKGKKDVEFFGTNPVDLPSCYVCHSGQGKAAKRSRQDGLRLFDKEYEYWKKNYPDESELMARLSQTSIDVLELHDKDHGTQFLKEYNPDASSNRLGSAGAVYCADCHGDNISGNLQSPRPGATGYDTRKAPPLTEAVHKFHNRQVPMPDKAGRAQNCQACHPMHWQLGEMNDPAHNPHDVVDAEGEPRFSKADVRVSGGGCYLGRDAHTNPHVKPPFFLNDIGKWYLNEVSLKDENGKSVSGLRGLYCTNCHSPLSQILYREDNFVNAVTQEGTTLRNKPVDDVIKAAAGSDVKKFREYFADPLVGAGDDPLISYYSEHTGAAMVKATKDEKGTLTLLPWNADKGDSVPYDAASGGKDWWLSAVEPHCADCHVAPYVESAGGGYFPIDQPNKYSLYRYSKAHGNLACQSCHESIHGLYPVRYEGPKSSVDLTTHEQALQFSPDGKYAGPVTCAACHTVNRKGVPVQLRGTGYYGDYWAAITLIHFMRGDDRKLPVADLVRKYPFNKSRETVSKGWK
jgi:mono/diheme cytochrome c family protein